jgi:hypothetical protein
MDLTGIALPLIPAKLNEIDILADHLSILSTRDSWIYGGGLTSWQIRKQVIGLPSTVTNAV